MGGGSGDGDDGGGEPPSWSWAEDKPGEGERPEWLEEKHATVEQQAKNYVELQKRFGSFTGAPKIEGEATHGYSSDGFVPSGVEGFEVPEDDVFVDNFLPMFQELNMSQESVDRVAQKYFALDLDRKNAEQARVDGEMTSLGSNADARLSAISDYARSNMDPDEHAAVMAGITSANAVKGLEKIISKNRPTRLSDTSDPAPSGITQQELMALQMATDDNGNRLMNDPEYRAMVREKRRQLVGD